MDPEEAELRIAQYIQDEPGVQEALSRLWNDMLSGERQPNHWQSTMLDIWLRLGGDGVLYDTPADRELADNEMLREPND